MLKKITGLVAAVILAACVVAAAAENPKPNVIPAMQQWQGAQGNFILTEKSRICVDPAAGDKLDETAKIFRADIKAITGISVKVVKAARPSKGDFLMSLSNAPKMLGSEGYVLSVLDFTSIIADTPTGVFYGTRSALQILVQAENKNTLPRGTALDWPSYRLRSVLIDTARKFYPYEVMCDYIRYLGWLKMNEIHFHLNDNSFSPGYYGFRVESDQFPTLASKDGFYTKKQIRQMQDLAKSYGITITPEFDSPGHARAFTTLRPDLMHPRLGDHYLDVTNPGTYELMEKVFDEMIPLFDAPDVHIGTDEYRIHSIPADQRKEVGEAFRKYINHFNKYIRAKGKNVRIWSGYESMPGTTEPDTSVIIDMWVSNDAKNKSARGHKIINSYHGWTYIVPGAPYYGVSNSFIYNNWRPEIFNTAKPEMNLKADDPALLGGKLHVWNDLGPTGYTHTEIAKLVIPSLVTFSEKLWGTKDSADYAQFQKRMALIPEAPGTDLFARTGDDAADGLVYDSGKEQIIFDSSDDFKKLPFADANQNLEYPWTASMKVMRTDASPARQVLMSSDIAELCLDLEYKTKDKKKGEIVHRGIGFERVCYYQVEPLRTFHGRRSLFTADDYKVPVNEWITVTFIANARSTAIYVDGKLIGNTREQMVCPLASIGSQRGDSFVGKIKDIKVYNRILNVREIAALAGIEIPVNLAVGAGASAFAEDKSYGLVAPNMTDGNPATRWSSGQTGKAGQVTIDLGSVKKFNMVRINWETAFAKKCGIEVSTDGSTFTSVADIEGAKGVTTATFEPTQARYVRLNMSQPATQWGYSIWEVEVCIKK